MPKSRKKHPDLVIKGLPEKFHFAARAGAVAAVIREKNKENPKPVRKIRSAADLTLGRIT